jgi:hypothetical protein
MFTSFAGLAIATALKNAQGLISPVVTPAALIPLAFALDQLQTFNTEDTVVRVSIFTSSYEWV